MPQVSPELYCVFGNPIAHSKSPQIQMAFAQQTGQNICYEKRQVGVDSPQEFIEAVNQLIAQGGRGANVTVPFKQLAWQLCMPDSALERNGAISSFKSELSPRARDAGAVNTLCFESDRIYGDNTDGIGLIRDITQNLGRPLLDQRVLLLGAGGAARGVLALLANAGVSHLTLANRTPEKAEALLQALSPDCSAELTACALNELREEYDVVINATAASLGGQALDLPDRLYAPGSLAYDMMYGQEETPFLAHAKIHGAGQAVDGLGMLVEQAAESFYLWRKVHPDSALVLNAMRTG